jgi:hypothetical protein
MAPWFMIRAAQADISNTKWRYVGMAHTASRIITVGRARIMVASGNGAENNARCGISRCCRLRIDSSGSNAQSFSFSQKEFVEKFNAALKVDTSPGQPPSFIKSCKKTKGGDTICLFDDATFKSSVNAFKEINVMNGNFELKSRILFSESSGKVSLVLLEGDRSDPSNLAMFIGYLGSAIRAMDPKATDDSIQKSLLTLEVMRGDSAPDIGHPIDDIEDYADVRCNTQPSSVSTKVACAFIPRF